MSINNGSTAKRFAIHLLFWVGYVALEYLANIFHIRPGNGQRHLISILLSLPVLIVPVYFIALYAVPRYLQQKKTGLLILSILLAAAVVYYGRIKWLEAVNWVNYGSYYSPPWSKVLKNVIRDYSVIALAVCIYIISDWRKKEKLNQQLIQAKAKMEVQLLKSQLHPHFLFNTLNNLYSLAMQNSSLTAPSILKLSELLDYLVYQSNKDRIALNSEVKLIKNYIDLEQLRHGKVLQVDMDIDELDDSVKTAPLILLPFIENCFKHGGKDSKGNFWINVKLKYHRPLLVLSVVNSKKHHPKAEEPKSMGIGLKNIKERLTLLYPNKFHLDIADNNDNFSIHLELQING